MSSLHRIAVAAVLTVTSCCPPKQGDTVIAHPDPRPVVTPDAPPPMISAYDQALADIARLTAAATQDVLLAPWTGPYGGVPPWDRVKLTAFPSAFETGIALRSAEVTAIAEDPDEPSFANTFATLEDAGRHFDRARTLWGVEVDNMSTPEVQKLDAEWAPEFARATDEITFNAKLFARIAAIHAARDSEVLSPEQKRLVELTYDRFVQAGARLSAEQKAAVGKINQELAGLFTEFQKKVLADENTWVVLAKPEDLAGLPDSLKAAYKAAAEERKLSELGVVVNTRSMVDPFLASSSRRDLREQVWKAFKNRGDNGNANDTNATMARIVLLRAQRAALLGYASHAHYRMADTMAKDPAKADELMMKVWPAAVARVREEVAAMQKLANKDKPVVTIEPWDYLYYAEKVRKARYAISEDELKPYFVLDNMIAASMYMAEQLYGLSFTEITGSVPVNLPEIRVWEVKNPAGDHVGLFYGDYFARAGKRSGAWMNTYRSHETFSGTVLTTIATNNNNFVKAAKDQPILISIDDAEVLFHEFGHAIHYLLSEVNYPGLGNVPRDFVEYPSQVHEMWVLTRPVLDKFGKHYKTGKPMPQKLIAKVEASKRFNQGYSTVEFLASAILDMALHTLPDGKVDPKAFERDTLAKLGAPKEVALRHRLPQFLHLFGDDSYSAGYYSYLWSQVMDADTREAFAEAGNVFDKTVAGKMKRYILAPGNSTDRAAAYREFRGRDPDVKALLRLRGFPVPK